MALSSIALKYLGSNFVLKRDYIFFATLADVHPLEHPNVGFPPEHRPSTWTDWRQWTLYFCAKFNFLPAWDVSCTCTTRVEDSNNVGAHSPWTILSWNGIEPPDFWPFLGVWLGGGDESKWHRAESQWIVAARPLCHLQYPVAYLSRLQRILPAARWELYFKAARTAHLPHELSQRHVPLGAEAPTAGRQTGGGRMRRF